MGMKTWLRCRMWLVNGEVVAESREVHGGDVKIKTNLMNREPSSCLSYRAKIMRRHLQR